MNKNKREPKQSTEQSKLLTFVSVRNAISKLHVHCSWEKHCDVFFLTTRDRIITQGKHFSS